MVGQKGKQHLGQSREDREYRKAQNQAAKKLQFTKKDKTELLRAIMSHGLLRSKVGARFKRTPRHPPHSVPVRAMRTCLPINLTAT